MYLPKAAAPTAAAAAASVASVRAVSAVNPPVSHRPAPTPIVATAAAPATATNATVEKNTGVAGGCRGRFARARQERCCGICLGWTTLGRGTAAASDGDPKDATPPPPPPPRDDGVRGALAPVACAEDTGVPLPRVPGVPPLLLLCAVARHLRPRRRHR